MKKRSEVEMSLDTALCGMDDLKRENERLSNELALVRKERDQAVKLLHQTEGAITHVALKIKLADFFEQLHSNDLRC